ncbi:hypothetical protein PYW07_010492 [Mythimna separata]|uniref:Vitellogenin domain-containing protein n=1 Tax=Mythimna separata TaxID=271217 RepID=A0AAD7Y9Y0_MYTSE|nr:hypothetical protein PYW07_010492 [Mythimna separata]
MFLCVIFLCLCITGTVYGSPNSLKDPYICGPPSCAASEKFKYLLDIIYHYEYKVNVETYFAGSSNNRSTLYVKAETKIQFITPCEGFLQLTDVTLIDQDENYPVERAEKFIHALSLYDLRFAFHDGIISEVCPEPEEEDWVLNFKRAILALYQNSMKRFDINFKGIEQDIHGTCNVDYTVRGQENTSLILVKTRDLSQCTNRYKYMSILQTVRYDFQSKFQTWPVLKSESKCRITVDHHIYKAVSCRERHLFEPFSGKNSGAMTTVVQDLVLLREVNKTDTEVIESQPKAWAVIPRRANLLHHHLVYVGDDTGGLKSARDVLKLLCMVKDTTTDHHSLNVDENMDSGSTVGLWGRLVRSARPLHYPALAQLLSRAPSICKSATKHILDALPYIASPGSVELIKDMIMKNEVDEETRQEWLMSMAMIPRPKLQMLESMLELLQKQKNDKVISFTVSSMVHSYCKHSGKELRECCEEEIPNAILMEFETIVQEIAKKGVIKTREDRKNIKVAIKALGNIGGFRKEFGDVLMNIIGDSFVPVPVRLGAVDAFRRTNCDETREYFLETFRADYMNLEVRLASYLQVMKCPDLGTLRKIFHTLQDEPVNQVTTFVWSHLKNLAESSLPSRVEIQGLLSGNQIPHLEDSPDFRMYSRNYEQGVFFDQYNAGGNYEANVIFTPDSYIPRSFSLNLTVDMFGESINLFEMKARGEGFESYFERYFGNNGPLNKNKLTEKISNMRFFRSTNEADEVREKIDNLEYKNEALKHRFPMAELGIKVFGNEISYWNAEGDEEIMKSLARMNPQIRVLEILSGKEISYNKASLFLDTTFSVPTGAGLPMNMNLMGTSYVNTKMSGTVNDKYTQSGNLDFEGKLRPSYVNTKMSGTVNDKYTQSGNLDFEGKLRPSYVNTKMSGTVNDKYTQSGNLDFEGKLRPSYVNTKMSGTVNDKYTQSGNLDFEGKLRPSYVNTKMSGTVNDKYTQSGNLDFEGKLRPSYVNTKMSGTVNDKYTQSGNLDFEGKLRPSYVNTKMSGTVNDKYTQSGNLDFEGKLRPSYVNTKMSGTVNDKYTQSGNLDFEGKLRPSYVNTKMSGTVNDKYTQSGNLDFEGKLRPSYVNTKMSGTVNDKYTQSGNLDFEGKLRPSYVNTKMSGTVNDKYTQSGNLDFEGKLRPSYVNTKMSGTVNDKYTQSGNLDFEGKLRPSYVNTKMSGTVNDKYTQSGNLDFEGKLRPSYVNTKMSGTVNDKYTQSGNLDFEGKLRPSYVNTKMSGTVNDKYTQSGNLDFEGKLRPSYVNTKMSGTVNDKYTQSGNLDFEGKLRPSYVNTKMSGTVNDKYTQSGNLDFEGKLRPSVAVNIAATMSVDAGGLSSSGIRVNWRLYTATAVEAKLSIRGLAMLKLDLSLPIDKQEIFAAKSELIILHGDKEQQQQGLNKNRIEQNTCSWSTFDKAIGIKMCASYQFPNMTNLRNAPYFLMSGPAKYILSLEKADPTANTYAFQYRWDKNETSNVVSFSFDTPDSKEKRMINAVLSLSNTSSTALLTLQSEKSTLIAKAMYRNMPYDKSLSASLDVDGRKQFDTVMSVKRHDIKYGFVWIPHAYWVVDNERVAELSGE